MKLIQTVKFLNATYQKFYTIVIVEGCLLIIKYKLSSIYTIETNVG